MSESSTQGLARSLRKARQSLEEEWQDIQTACFTNTSIKHAVIAMADIGVKAVHSSLHTIRAQALQIGTGGHGLSTQTKHIPIWG